MPSNWRTTSLGAICKFSAGSAFKPEHQGFSTGDYPFIKVSDMNAAGNELFITVAANYVNDLQRTAMKAKLHPTGATVFAKIGVALTTNRRRLLTRPTIIDNNMMSATPRDGKVTSRFLFLLLTSIDFNTISAGTALPYLNVSDLERIEVSIPDCLTEQESIAKIAGDLDDKIDLNRRINQTLEAMAQAIFKSWFVDFDPVKAKIAAKAEGRGPLRAAMSAISGKAEAELDALPPEAFEQLAATAELFPDEMQKSESGAIPKGWVYKDLALLTDKIGSGSTPRGGKEVYLEEGIALIRSQNVYDSSFVWEGLARISNDAATQLKGVTVQEDDVLLNITGASILRTCVVEPEVLPARVNQHVAIIRAKAGVPPRFIHMHLLRPDIKSYLLGLNAGASREAITKAHIENLTLLTPGAELLRAFQMATDPLFRQVQRFAHQVRVLAELRDTLLPKLLSGELPVEAIAESTGAA